MKKSILLLLACVGFAHADINVTPGVGTTVHADTSLGLQTQMIEIMGPGAGASTATVTTIGFKVDLSSTQVMNSTITANSSNIVSSNTLPAPVANGGQVEDVSDPFGRDIFIGGIWESTVTYSTMTLTSSTPRMLVSTYTINGYVRMCGCTFTNVSASSSSVTLFPLNPSLSSGTLHIGIPANGAPSGIPFHCEDPFMSSYIGSSINIQADPNVSIIYAYCKSYGSL